ncbi:hypothetical protein [uncultured Cetobacterium sp.]|uniref:hypothetical protein n=1 Tax=uncultured Cetobacterium sp. TaxID=527638 RepID=UPI002639B52D|nr:hypothetical protein [uncultured Cetobacterium sp.]
MKRYIYIGNDLQINHIFLRKNMVISKKDLELILKENKKVEPLFILTEDYSNKKNDLKNKDSFLNKKLSKIQEEVLKG